MKPKKKPYTLPHITRLEKPPKKPYSKPKLTVYGDVRQMTESQVTGMRSDRQPRRGRLAHKTA